MHRVPEVIDCWFDSGSMPFAQYHYPFENKELFEEQFPADFISEAVDQTRGWFYSLLAISTLIFDKAPFKNVIVLGHVQDENGQKMSQVQGQCRRSVRSARQPTAPTRSAGISTPTRAPWLPEPLLTARRSAEGQRKFMGTLWNTYAFFVLYADIDEFDRDEIYARLRQACAVMDKWILSRLNTHGQDSRQQPRQLSDSRSRDGA